MRSTGLTGLLALLLTGCGGDDPRPPGDAGLDAPARPDAAADAGPPVDTGPGVDSSRPGDAGPRPDSGPATDSGPAVDGGGGTDNSCTAVADCVFSVYDADIAAAADCYCLFCPTNPLNRETHDRRAAQYAALCTPGVDGMGGACPAVRCARPGPIDCVGEVCVPDERPNACVEGSDCVFSVYADDILTAADCYCPLCPVTPLNTWTHAGRMTRYDALCTPGFDAMGRPCPIPACVRPPPIECNAGLCE